MKKRWVVLLALLLVSVALFVLWRFVPRDLPRSFVLPDSNRVTLVAVTVGTNSSMNFGSPVERVLARLPARLGKPFQRNVVHAGAEDRDWTNIIFWFAYDSPPPPNSSIDAGFAVSSWRFRSGLQILPNGKAVCYAGTPLWPRREKNLKVNLAVFRGKAEYHRIGEVTISNPDHRKYPEWTAEPLPATRRFENVNFTLDELRASRHQFASA